MRILRHALLEDHFLQDSVTEPLNGATFDLSLGALAIDGLADVVAGGEPRDARLARFLVHLDFHRLRAESVVVEGLPLPGGGIDGRRRRRVVLVEGLYGPARRRRRLHESRKGHGAIWSAAHHGAAVDQIDV